MYLKRYRKSYGLIRLKIDFIHFTKIQAKSSFSTLNEIKHSSVMQSVSGQQFVSFLLSSSYVSQEATVHKFLQQSTLSTYLSISMIHSSQFLDSFSFYHRRNAMPYHVMRCNAMLCVLHVCTVKYCRTIKIP